ncbi:hypothetical protein DL768_000706 [Monosporascus sp. mg162]|nr:hypothetical protein DL768_000706 [Monosporascus sp. mg162]
MLIVLSGGRCAAMDIVPLYSSSGVQDNLVTQPRFGASLAEVFVGNRTFSEDVFVFTKQHGFVACAATIEEAVYQAFCAKEVAAAKTAQVALRQVYHGAGVEFAVGTEALSPEQVEGPKDFPARLQPAPWELRDETGRG